MKNIVIFLSLILFLASCGSKIEEAKKEMLEPETSATQVVETSSSLEEQPKTTPREQEKDIENRVSITPLSEVQFIEISPILESSLDDGEVLIQGKTLGEVTKIEVSFSNADSEFPDDNYTLQTFKSGADSFKYVASSRFQVLDFGVNTYLIKAYSGKEVSETQVILSVEEQKDTTISYEEKVLGTEDDSIVIDLPKSELFGNPISLGTDSFTYTDIESFEIQRKDVTGITCEGLTDYLADSINTWYYWNTCRDIVKEKGISFYVIQLTGEENYVYKKHYIDYVHGLYGVFDIEMGVGVDKDNISEKNTELKELNATMENVGTVDSLMKSIVSQK